MKVAITTLSFEADNCGYSSYNSHVRSWGNKLQETEFAATICNQVAVKTSVGNPNNFIVVDSTQNDNDNEVDYYFFEPSENNITFSAGNFSVIGNYRLMATIHNNDNKFNIDIDKSMLDNYAALMQEVIDSGLAKQMIDEKISMMQYYIGNTKKGEWNYFWEEWTKYTELYDKFNTYMAMITPSVFQTKWENREQIRKE